MPCFELLLSPCILIAKGFQGDLTLLQAHFILRLDLIMCRHVMSLTVKLSLSLLTVLLQIAILKDCRNVHVVQFLGACMHPGCTMLITELMAANAQDLIHSGQLPWKHK